MPAVGRSAAAAEETAAIFGTSWDTVYRAIDRVGRWSLVHRESGEIEAIGVDEIASRRGHKYITLVYQIDADYRRLLYVVRDRTEKSLRGFFSTVPASSIEMAGMLRRHRELMLNWFRARGEIPNGSVEQLDASIEQHLVGTDAVRPLPNLNFDPSRHNLWEEGTASLKGKANRSPKPKPPGKLVAGWQPGGTCKLSLVAGGVGRIVTTLNQCGLEQDTLIFIIGDNGAPLKIHKIDAPGGGPGWDGSLNDPMNGEKGMLTEGGIRVPFVVHWKGRIPGGQVYSHPVISLDVGATVCALAGLPEDPDLDGVNLIPYLTGQKTGAPHEVLFWRWIGQSAIRKGNWKYLRSNDREYLFDLDKDFEETKDLLASYPEIAKSLKSELSDWAQTQSPPGIWAVKSDGMSHQADKYFDWYLDGKRAVPVPPAKTKVRKNRKPNILFIAIDDLNDYISPLDNHPGIKTPNFDRLARRSVTFSNAHCAAPACHPSRVAVMTGVHPVKSGIYRNLFGAQGPRWRHESPVLEDAVVISQHFRNHGYRAVGGGKLFHTLQWTKGDSQNDPDAWDDYRGDPLDPISADWPRPEFVQTTDQNEGFVGKRPLGSHLFGAAPLPLNADQGDGAVVDWATEQMNAEQDKPLFLAVGLFRQHIPFEVPQQWFDLYPESEVQLPAYLADDLADAYSHGREGWHQWVTDNDQWKPLMRGYLASISYVDHQIGRLLDGLDQSPMAKRTIVVLWSDHGFHIGEKQNREKFALWEQTTRTPLFIHAPGLSKDGAATRQPATLTDLYPTLCELAGLPVPAQCTGASLVPQVIDPTKINDRVSLTSYSFAKDGKLASHAVSNTRYRFIKYSDGFEELYDLENDRNEFKNLASDPAFAQVKARLLKRIPQQFAKSVGPATDSPYHRANRRKK